jgi:GTP-binding protein Era
MSAASGSSGTGGAAGGPGAAGAAFRSGFVALIGRPNVGKSSLCNRLVGAKVSIVSDKPQTTRRRIAAVVHRPGAQLVLLDTPGMHKPRHRLGHRLVAFAREALDGVEAACLIVDAAEPLPGQSDRRAAAHVLAAGCPRLLVLNKIDLVPVADRLARGASYAALAPADAPFDDVLAVSAATGEGCAALIDAVLARLPQGPAYFPEDALTDQPEQFLAAELVREQALARLRDEVPHGLAVAVEEWAPRDSGLIYVRMTVYVERESQKGIVIGRDGAMLRAIGEAARGEIARRLGSPLYLDLWVKVKEGWRDRPGSLESLGFGKQW